MIKKLELTFIAVASILAGTLLTVLALQFVTGNVPHIFQTIVGALSIVYIVLIGILWNVKK